MAWKSVAWCNIPWGGLLVEMATLSQCSHFPISAGRGCCRSLNVLCVLETNKSSTLYICWFNFDALVQGNAYKPTKEPINYRGPGGDRTHDLQTEATPPAASCPARTLHATEIAPKNATSMTCPWLHWTTDNPSGMHRCQFQGLKLHYDSLIKIMKIISDIKK